MTIKQDFTKHLESQIAVWQAQIAEHQERLKQAGAQAKADYDKGVTEVQARAGEAGAKAKADYEAAIKQLQASAEEASKLLGKVRKSSEHAWTDMQTASGKAFEQLQKGWADALKRFG